MTRCGIEHPDVVDLVTQAQDGTIRLILAEADALTGHQAMALHEKLTNYVAYAKDGRLIAAYPAAQGRPVRIRVDLYAQPDALILELLKRFRVLALRDGIAVELSINQRDVDL